MSCFLPPIRAFPFLSNWVHCAVPRLVCWLYLVHPLARHAKQLFYARKGPRGYALGETRPFEQHDTSGPPTKPPRTPSYWCHTLFIQLLVSTPIVLTNIYFQIVRTYRIHCTSFNPTRSSRIQGRNTEKCQTKNIENKMRNKEEKEKTKHDINRTSY